MKETLPVFLQGFVHDVQFPVPHNALYLLFGFAPRLFGCFDIVATFLVLAGRLRVFGPEDKSCLVVVLSIRNNGSLGWHDDNASIKYVPLNNELMEGRYIVGDECRVCTLHIEGNNNSGGVFKDYVYKRKVDSFGT